MERTHMIRNGRSTRIARRPRALLHPGATILMAVLLALASMVQGGEAAPAPGESTTLGDESTTLGDESTTLGDESTTLGDESTTLGDESTKSGGASAAPGYAPTPRGPGAYGAGARGPARRVPLTFDEPQAAVDALVAAVRERDLRALVTLLGRRSRRSFGHDGRKLEQAAGALFVAAYDNAHELEPRGTDGFVLLVGEDRWAFPFPLRRTQGGWMFDEMAGREETRRRRIGYNELAVVEVCRAFAQAQKEYFDLNPEKAPAPHYAERLESQPGRKDGLYWSTEPGEPESPVGINLARASHEGTSNPPGGRSVHRGYRSFFGYFFKMLDRQGEKAPGGERNYRGEAGLTGGFALVAVPAVYGQTGVQSFLVGADGVVYEKDLGPGTRGEAVAIDAYEPLDGWKRF